MKYLFLFSSLFMLAGCASTYARITDPLGKDVALVDLREEKVAKGDMVSVSERECKEIERRSGVRTQCINRTLGQAKVMEFRADKNEAVIKSENETPLTRGLWVEKIIQ